MNADVQSTEELIATIKAQARIYTDDNIRNPSARDYVFTENAMLIGSVLATNVLLER